MSNPSVRDDGRGLVAAVDAGGQAELIPATRFTKEQCQNTTKYTMVLTGLLLTSILTYYGVKALSELSQEQSLDLSQKLDDEAFLNQFAQTMNMTDLSRAECLKIIQDALENCPQVFQSLMALGSDSCSQVITSAMETLQCSRDQATQYATALLQAAGVSTLAVGLRHAIAEGAKYLLVKDRPRAETQPLVASEHRNRYYIPIPEQCRRFGTWLGRALDFTAVTGITVSWLLGVDTASSPARTPSQVDPSMNMSMPCTDFIDGMLSNCSQVMGTVTNEFGEQCLLLKNTIMGEEVGCEESSASYIAVSVATAVAAGYITYKAGTAFFNWLKPPSPAAVQPVRFSQPPSASDLERGQSPTVASPEVREGKAEEERRPHSPSPPRRGGGGGSRAT